MGNRFGLAIGLALLAAALNCSGQDAPQQSGTPTATAPARTTAPTGTAASPRGDLTGTVLCADTNLPARLANVSLLQDSTSSNTDPGNSPFRLGATTDLEGRFFIENVPEGRYYVVAVQPGYLNLLRMFTEVTQQAAGSDERKAFEALAPEVEISAVQPAQVSIRLERASEIDGTVLYDDGSPAVSLLIRATRKTAQAGKDATEPGAYPSMVESMQQLPATTDDRGQFRIIGVAPGEYLVGASLMAFSGEAGASAVYMPVGLDVFAGGGFQTSKANPVKVGSGDIAVDADITIPLSKLHTIHGHLVLKNTGQPPAAASVQLLFADTREPARIVYVVGGEFEIDSVPEESYILQAASASTSLLPEVHDSDGGPAPVASGRLNLPMSPNPDTDTESAAEMPVLVTGDVDSITITLPDTMVTAPEPQTQPEATTSVGVGPAVSPVVDSAPDNGPK